MLEAEKEIKRLNQLEEDNKNKSDLELQDKKLVKKQVEIKDPIVLCPVFFKNSKHYLIVTAWGKEASDSEVINQKLN